MSIFISAGHSNTDPGAVANGVKESEVVVEFRNMVAFYLRKAKVGHATDGEYAENWSLNKACAAARGYPVAVEFHLNASDNPRATGVETLSAPKDYRLGGNICKAVSRILDIRNRGAKPEGAGQHKRLAFVRAGGIIVELFFVTNKHDLAMYAEKKWLVAKTVASIIKDEAACRRPFL